MFHQLDLASRAAHSASRYGGHGMQAFHQFADPSRALTARRAVLGTGRADSHPVWHGLNLTNRLVPHSANALRKARDGWVPQALRRHTPPIAVTVVNALAETPSNSLRQRNGACV